MILVLRNKPIVNYRILQGKAIFEVLDNEVKVTPLSETVLIKEEEVCCGNKAETYYRWSNGGWAIFSK